MSDHMQNLLSPTDPQPSSSGDSINSRSSITIESPRHGGRHRDFIWTCFNDMGPAKTPGHRKAQCKYCLLCLNFAKLHVMYSHIAHQCDEVINYNPNVRKEIILKMRDFEQQPSPSRNKKRFMEV